MGSHTLTPHSMKVSGLYKTMEKHSQKKEQITDICTLSFSDSTRVRRLELSRSSYSRPPGMQDKRKTQNEVEKTKRGKYQYHQTLSRNPMPVYNLSLIHISEP